MNFQKYLRFHYFAETFLLVVSLKFSYEKRFTYQEILALVSIFPENTILLLFSSVLLEIYCFSSYLKNGI